MKTSFIDTRFEIVRYTLNSMTITINSLRLILVFCLSIPLLNHSITAKAIHQNNSFQSQNSNLFNLNDSILFVLQEQFPLINKELSTDELEAFITSFQFDSTLPRTEDANLLRGIYGKYKRKLKEQTKINLLLKLAFIYNRQIKTNEVFATLKELKEYALNESQLAMYHYYYGLAEQDKSNFESALSLYMKSLPVFEQEGNQNVLAGIYSDLGRLYNSNKDYKNSIEYYLKAVNTAEIMKDTTLMAKTYSNIGTTYEKTQEDEVAIAYYNKGLRLSEILGDSLKIAQNLLNIGNVYTKLKKFPEAHEQYLQSLAICEKKNIAYGKLLNYMNIGLNAKDWGKYELALSMTDLGLNLVNEMDLPLEKASLLKVRSELFAAIRNFENAYQLLNEAEELEQEIYDKEKQARIEELTVKYETTIKEKELENASLQIQSSQQRIKFLVILVVLILLSTVVVVGFYRSRAIKIKALYLKNLETLAQYKKSKEIIKNQIGGPHNLKKNLNQFEDLFEQIKESLIQNENYKDADLNLNILAQMVKSNSKYVSQAIQQHTDKNFNTYINHLRVMEAQKLIQESLEELNLNDVMYACGFKSRSTFYTAFQKETGMSPKQYKDLAISDIKLDKEITQKK